MDDAGVTLPDRAWLKAFRTRLAAWYSKHARDLPWRRSQDPYAVWLSEVMLQQTQVETVKPYFQRFLAAFPTIAALAAADEREVLRLWEGLGYYRRARQLHRAAKIIANEHGGRFPSHPEAVRKLPGIGRYTAGAVLSIAFDQQEPILEANTARLYSRLLAYRGNGATGEGQKLLWSMAEVLLPSRGCGHFNQALMELGSAICRPRQPQCEACPVQRLCRARASGLQDQIPLAKTRRVAEEVREAAVVVRRRGRVLVIEWPEGRRWAGLWDFPRVSLTSEGPAENRRELIEQVKTLTGVTITLGEHLKTLRHSVTRFRITLDCYAAEYVAHEPPASPLTQKWIRPAELAAYPLSSTGRKLARLVCE